MPSDATLSGLLRGRIPAAEGGGLFGLIEGLLLVLLLATAVTGAVWFAMQGSQEALAWRSHHIFAARGLVGSSSCTSLRYPCT